MLRAVILSIGLLALIGGPVESETYYVAPLETQLSGVSDGSEALPFLSIQAAFASGKVKGGDTLLLKDGAYGRVILEANATFDSPVTITSQNGKAAHFDSIRLGQQARFITLKNLSVWPRNPAESGAYLVRSYETVSDISVVGLDIRSEEGAADFMSWDATRWSERKFHGIVLKGLRNKIVGNKLTAVYDGISAGPEALIANNVVNGFDGDGIRAVRDTTVRNNRVTNCVKTDANHDDGFQSFVSNDGPITNLVLDSNTIIEWMGPADHPLRCKLQGIGLFGGPYINLTVINNLVSVSHSHGISIYGAYGAMVLNNTIVNNRGVADVVPYLAVRPLGDGTPSENVLAANNLAMSISGQASVEYGIEFRDNSIIGAPSLVFENPFAFDYRPKASSGYIDSGDSTVAPTKDIIGAPRPSGEAADRGAFELQSGGGTVIVEEPVVEPPPVVEPEPEPTPTPTTGPKRVKPPKKFSVQDKPTG